MADSVKEIHIYLKCIAICNNLQQACIEVKRAITGQTYEKGGVWDPCIEIRHQMLKDLGWRATGVLLKAVGIRNVVNFSQIKK